LSAIQSSVQFIPIANGRFSSVHDRLSVIPVPTVS